MLPVTSLAEELVARVPLTVSELGSVMTAAPLGVAANSLIRLAPIDTQHLFDALCLRAEHGPRAARLDAYLRLDAVTVQRRTRLELEGRGDGPVAEAGHIPGNGPTITATTDPLTLPAVYASLLTTIAPELFARVVIYGRARLHGSSWETLAVLTADGCELPMGEVIDLAVRL